jgi:hypothetical protein
LIVNWGITHGVYDLKFFPQGEEWAGMLEKFALDGIARDASAGLK